MIETISPWIRLMVFAFLLRLSMDYEVFILARVREEYDRTAPTRYRTRQPAIAPRQPTGAPLERALQD